MGVMTGMAEEGNHSKCCAVCNEEYPHTHLKCLAGVSVD